MNDQVSEIIRILWPENEASNDSAGIAPAEDRDDLENEEILKIFIERYRHLLEENE